MPTSFPVIIPLPQAMSGEQAIERIRNALKPELIMTFPVKPGSAVPQFPIDLDELLDVREEDAAAGKRLVIEPKADIFDQVAYRWNISLSQLPPKAIPRSQRLALSLLGRKLTAEPTGQRTHDYARRRILDTTQKGIGPTIAAETQRRAGNALA